MHTRVCTEEAEMHVMHSFHMLIASSDEGLISDIYTLPVQELGVDAYRGLH
jgi:hypothetical protein